MKNSKLAKSEVICFMAVGGAAALIHYILYISLLAIGVTYNIAYVISFIANLICNFFGSNLITFKTKPTFARAFKFLLSNGVNFVVHMLIFNCSIWLGAPEKLAPIFAYTFTFPINFILVKISLKGINHKKQNPI